MKTPDNQLEMIYEDPWTQAERIRKEHFGDRSYTFNTSKEADIEAGELNTKLEQENITEWRAEVEDTGGTSPKYRVALKETKEDQEIKLSDLAA